MGLDAVELIMATEEAFGVELSDGDAEKCVTPKLLIDCVYSKLKQSDEQSCRSQKAFYLVRHALVKTLNIPRNKISPDTPLSSIIPAVKQDHYWNELKTNLNAKSFPPLCRSESLSQLIYRIAATVGLTCGITIILSGSPVKMLVPAVLGGMLSMSITLLLGYSLTKSQKKFIPIYSGTVKDLLPYAQTAVDAPWDRDSVAMTFKAILIEQIGIPEQNYDENKHFINDYGLD